MLFYCPNNYCVNDTGERLDGKNKGIFEDGELMEESVIKKYLITAADGKSYNTKHYNLQAIIAVGFKVNNDRSVRFRKWAGQIVKDCTIQGWTMDKERLKKGHMFTDEYFERQLQNIREIRLSERKFYQKVTDLYANAFQESLSHPQHIQNVLCSRCENLND